MTLAALRDDALSSTTDGFALRLSLPWIRSLPLASLDGVEVVVDGERVDGVTVALGDRLVDPAGARGRSARGGSCRTASSCAGQRMLRPGAHEVAVTFRLAFLHPRRWGPTARSPCRSDSTARSCSMRRRQPPRSPVMSPDRQGADVTPELPDRLDACGERLQLDARRDPRRARRARASPSGSWPTAIAPVIELEPGPAVAVVPRLRRMPRSTRCDAISTPPVAA